MVVLVCICGAHQDHQCLRSLDWIATVMDIMEVATRLPRPHMLVSESNSGEDCGGFTYHR